MLFAFAPPAEEKWPPAICSLLNEARENSRSLMPAPSGCQLVSFQRAMLLAEELPAMANDPAATSSPLNTERAATFGAAVPVRPLPRVLQFTPSQTAMQPGDMK